MGCAPCTTGCSQLGAPFRSKPLRRACLCWGLHTPGITLRQLCTSGCRPAACSCSPPPPAAHCFQASRGALLTQQPAGAQATPRAVPHARGWSGRWACGSCAPAGTPLQALGGLPGLPRDSGGLPAHQVGSYSTACDGEAQGNALMHASHMGLPGGWPTRRAGRAGRAGRARSEGAVWAEQALPALGTALTAVPPLECAAASPHDAPPLMAPHPKPPPVPK